MSHKIDLKDKYNINVSLDDVIDIKNETVCRVAKMSPKELFFNKDIDEKEIERINNLMLKSQTYSNVYKNTYEIGEKIFQYLETNISEYNLFFVF